MWNIIPSFSIRGFPIQKRWRMIGDSSADSYNLNERLYSMNHKLWVINNDVNRTMVSLIEEGIYSLLGWILCQFIYHSEKNHLRLVHEWAILYLTSIGTRRIRHWPTFNFEWPVWSKSVSRDWNTMYNSEDMKSLTRPYQLWHF